MFCYDKNYALIFAGSVQNRSVLNENLYWENKFGYDLNFDTMNVDSSGKNRIKMNQVVLHPEADETILPDIIINSEGD